MILQYYDTNINEEVKQDNTPVTIADRLIEELMREKIIHTFPEHGIIGEEFGSERTSSEFVWVIDPIDGTKSFLSGVPLFGTLIGLTHYGQPVMGVFYQPILDKTMVGNGEKTFLNDRLIRCSSVGSIQHARLMTTDIHNIQKYQNFTNFLNLSAQTKLTRTWGDCFGYYLLAQGSADIMLDPIVSVWDTTAIIPIVMGAGAKITDWKGGSPINGKSLVATPFEIHDEVLSFLNQSKT